MSSDGIFHGTPRLYKFRFSRWSLHFEALAKFCLPYYIWVQMSFFTATVVSVHVCTVLWSKVSAVLIKLEGGTQMFCTRSSGFMEVLKNYADFQGSWSDAKMTIFQINLRFVLEMCAEVVLKNPDSVEALTNTQEYQVRKKGVGPKVPYSIVLFCSAWYFSRQVGTSQRGSGDGGRQTWGVRLLASLHNR